MVTKLVSGRGCKYPRTNCAPKNVGQHYVARPVTTTTDGSVALSGLGDFPFTFTAISFSSLSPFCRYGDYRFRKGMKSRETSSRRLSGRSWGADKTLCEPHLGFPRAMKVVRGQIRLSEERLTTREARSGLGQREKRDSRPCCYLEDHGGRTPNKSSGSRRSVVHR